MISAPIITPISRSIARGINEAEVGFNPLSLFASGEQGAWYDPSDLSTLFQDAAGTIPVTGAGQPVGLMLDKSGRGNHASRATATSRPILQTANGLWYLAFDGVDDWLQTEIINFTGVSATMQCTGLRMTASATASIVVELSPNSGATATYPGTFSTFAPYSSNNYAVRSGGTLVIDAIATGIVAPNTSVLCGLGDIAGDSIILRVNGQQQAATSDDQGTGTLGEWPMFIGRRGDGSRPFKGNMHGLIIRGAKSTDAEITQTEAWMNSKTGAY